MTGTFHPEYPASRFQRRHRVVLIVRSWAHRRASRIKRATTKKHYWSQFDVISEVANTTSVHNKTIIIRHAFVIPFSLLLREHEHTSQSRKFFFLHSIKKAVGIVFVFLSTCSCHNRVRYLLFHSHSQTCNRSLNCHYMKRRQ